ncbi:beta-Ala-His dipeptidase [Pyrenophora tritici-repentis]|nr:Beta-Ala-His dipeptidase [Pyrenophora tritici-repentis]KAI1546615.1 beta-Ala-His dipeptidase [Pyrenophora tritici-repentis]KAI2478461.1 Beta-Ala-His dipeptidase [Pyrenophora tritici-repentis]PWO23025.1 exosome component 1 [Pyrenophora tritici-repentis]PZD32848.1 beta-Ala-His dipeptidase [Pyrenophora tritici-repentis]
MDEQQGSSSSEESSSGDETSSDITLHEIEEVNECLPCPPRVEPIAEAPISLSSEIDSRYIFPFHLISACSSAGRRAVMCTLTSQQVATAVLGLRAVPPHNDTPVETKGTEIAGPNAIRTPVQAHRMKHDKSILALAVSPRYIFAGTQGGEILVYSLDTYERRSVIHAHKGSVLGLCLSQDRNWLFSSAADPIVNVWCTSTFKHLYALWSPYDIGDIFCVAYSSYHRAVYFGAQNTSIQWYDLKEKDTRPAPSLSSHPAERKNKFFDSLGPGGAQTPRPSGADSKPRHAVGGQELQVDSHDICQFAHYGYVHCMLLGTGILPDAPSEEVLISGGGDGRILLWRIDPKRRGAISTICTLEDGREEGESILSLAREGSFLYSGRFDGEINVWDLETRQLVRSLKASTGDVHTLTLGAGILYAGGKTGIMQKFNEHYESVTTFKAHDGLILASAIARYSEKPILVTGGNDNTVVIWEVKDCAEPSAATRRSNNDLMVESLGQFVSFRTVSSLPKYRADCRRGASYLRSVFQNFGAVTEMINTSDYNPIVFAKFRGNPATAASRKKILFYGHYDVIAAENEHRKWKHDPFTLTGEGGYLYGRGASDNKGPIMAAIYAAHELANEQSLDSDIIFLIEGEEESGSRGFEKAVKARKDLIGDVDWILLANSYWLDDHVPCLTYGLRGVIHATVQVESKHPDLHSGVDGSALLDEPLKDLVMLLSKLTGRHGKVHIPGFYDPILPLTADEKDLYTEITETLLRSNPDLGDPEELAQSLMRRWREASLTIHRFQTSGPENSTIIPRLAKAALSIRLVPNQEAGNVAESLKVFLQAEFDELDSKNNLKLTIDHQAEPWLGDFNNEIFQTLERAIMNVWGPTLGQRRESTAAPDYFSSSSKTADEPPTPTTKHTPTPATSNTLANSSDPALTTSTPSSGTSTPHPTTGTDTASRKPLYIREGGSIPSIRFLEKEFNAPAAHLPCGQASDSAHLDNERLRLVNLYNSKKIFKEVFRELPKR